MEIKGALTYCDRCGFKIFRRGKLIPGTYGMVWGFFDDLPDGWEEFRDTHLCPKCSKVWNELVGRTDISEVKNA